MIISQLSIGPVGEGVSLSKYVKNVINVLKKNNIKFENHPSSPIYNVF